MVKDFPDTKELLEYKTYAFHSTKANASSLITIALELGAEHGELMPGTSLCAPERSGWANTASLVNDAVDLAATMDELNHYTENVWTHIISLHREDAERLGYAGFFLDRTDRPEPPPPPCSPSQDCSTT